MSVVEKQRHLVLRFGLIEDSHERLAAVVDRVRKTPPLADGERTDANRVQGCISRVWLVAGLENGCCRFRVDADSPLVRGLAALTCEVYDGGGPAEIAAFDSDILEQLHLDAQLTPTRRNGLEQLRVTIRAFAARAAGL